MKSPADMAKDVLEDLGHDLVGPCALAFAGFIATELQRRPVEKVLFGARDTYLIKEAFERLAPDLPSTYFRISRRALYLAEYAVTGDPKHFFEGRIDAADFFDRLGIAGTRDLSGLEPRRNRELFLESARESGLDEVAAAELALVRTYLRDVGFVGHVAFVDLGWRGNLHDAIAKIVGPACRIHGYYFGIVPDAKDKSGYYFSGRRPWRRYSRLAQAIPPFEFLFTEPAASLRRLIAAEPGYSFESVDDESAEQIASRHSIAKGCRRYLGESVPVLPKGSCEWAGRMLPAIESAIDAHLLAPSPGIVEALSGVWHSHSFGGTHRATLGPAAEFDLAGYVNSTWRAGYVLASRERSSSAWRMHRIVASPIGMAVVELVQAIVRSWRRLRDR